MFHNLLETRRRRTLLLNGVLCASLLAGAVQPIPANAQPVGSSSPRGSLSVGVMPQHAVVATDSTLVADDPAPAATVPAKQAEPRPRTVARPVAHRARQRTHAPHHKVMGRDADSRAFQGGGPIAYGQTVAGTIAVPGQVVTYTFSGNAGDRLVLRLGETSNDLNPELRVFRPDDTLLCNGISYGNLAELNCVLDVSGVHSIRVGSNFGGYRLYLQRSNSPADATAIAYGTTTSGILTNQPEMHAFGFNGSTGDRLVLRLGETSNDLNPELRVYRPNGTLLCNGINYGTLAELNCVLDSSGGHSILIGSNFGGYRLYLQRSNSPANSTAIAYGAAVAGTLTQPPEMHAFGFNGNTGDRLVLRLAEISNDVNPELRVYRPDGTLLCNGINYGSLAELNCALDTSGVHSVLVGSNFGGYRLYLQRSNSPASALPIAYGTTTSGILTNPPEMRAFGFSGTVGDRLVLRLGETSNDLNPELRVYRSDGTLLCNGINYGTLAELNCVLDSSGGHSILIGSNFGGYRLYLQRSNSPANSTAIAYGAAVAGTLTQPPEMHAFGFNGNTGDRLVLRLAEISNDVNPELRVYRPDGTLLCNGINYGTLAELNCVLDVSGGHAILVGSNSGGYRLYLQRSNSPVSAAPIASGITQTNQIDLNPEMDTYVVNGAIGDQVVLQLRETSDDLNPELRLYRPDGTLLCNGISYGNFAQLNCTLDTSGIHAIFVGSNIGGYTLFVQGFTGSSNVTDLMLGQQLTTQIQRNELQFYKLPISQPGRQLLLEVTPLSGVNNLWLSGLFGALPLAGRHDVQSLAPTPRGTYELLIAPTQAGTYYFSAFGRDIAAPGSYRIVARMVASYVSDVQPRAGGNAGPVTLNLLGLGFVEGMQVQLRGNGATLVADEVIRSSPTSASARFNLVGAALGAYDVHVIFPDTSEAALPGAFTINQGLGPRLEARLIVPDAVRRLTQSVMWIEYANTGDADMAAPLLVVSATTSVVMRLFTGEPFSDQAIQVLGVSVNGPAGALPPGARGRIPIYFQSNAPGGTQLSFTLSQMVADATPINWSGIEAAVRPNDIPAELWAVIWANFTARMGATWADYQRALDDQASYLSRYGSLTYDVRDLFGAFMSRASGATLRRTLAGSLDAYAPARGLPLALSRVAFDAFSQRFTLGPFGRGWSHNFEYTISRPDANTVVVKGPAGSGRAFIKAQNGAWQPSAGDYAKLEPLGDGSHRLREKDGQVWLFAPAGRLSYLEEPNGNRVTLSYNGTGQLTGISHTNGQSFSLGYDVNGRISRLTDHAGRATDYAYDASGEHLVSVVAPGGVTTQYAYVAGGAANHALQTITFADGTHVNYEYDAQGRLASQARDGNAERVTFTYDDLGTLSVTDAANATTMLRLGARGQPLEVQDPLGNRARFAYDCCARLTRVTQPSGATSTLAYDLLGNATQSTDLLGHATATAYTTDLSRLDWLRDAKNNVTDFTYDAKGNLTQMTYPDGSFEGYGYDGAGNLTGVTNRRNATITLTRNALGQITRKAYPDGRTIDYAYDPLGNLTSASDSATGAITLQYDARGFLARIDYPGGRWFTFEYSDAGRRTRRTGHDGYVLNYSYDAAGRLQRLSDGANAEIIRYEYDAAGRLSRENKANGTYSLYNYDAAGQLLSLVNHAPNGSAQSRFDYTYDANGNRTAMTALAGATRYGYDALGQLTGVTYPDNRQTRYVYDALGNRVSVTDNGAATSYTTNALNQYTQVGNASYGYDADGNMTSQAAPAGTTTYTYDAENRLTGVTAPGNNSSQYTYDALGNRITAVRNGAATSYLHDPIGLVDVAAEYDGGGALAARYVHGLGLVSRNGAGGVAYYAFDGTGHTRQMTDGGGGVVNSYDYEPFGVPLATNEAVANPFRYVGRFGVMEEGNAIYQMRKRFHASYVGRFLSLDLADLGFENRYLYTANNPVNLIDPIGLYPTLPAPPPTFRPLTPLERVLVGCMWLLFRCADTEAIEPGTRGLGKMPRGNKKVEKELPRPPGGKPGKENEDEESEEEKGEKFEPPLQPIQPKPPQVPDTPSDAESVPVAAASDPNEKVGPPGVGPARAVRPNDDLAYTIFFENVMTATAPALQVVVTDQLDPDLDWTTFRPTGVGFGSNTFALTQATDGFSLRATIPDYRPTVNKTWWVDMSAQINYATGTVTWTLQTLDPLTGQPPDDPLAGFLPPNDATHRGEGYVTFSVRPKRGLAVGTVVTNQAAIIFDAEATITTNVVSNTLAWVNLIPLALKDAKGGLSLSPRVRLPLVRRGPQLVLVLSQ